jgi:predicted O-methyltransferase YrrM
MYIIDLEPTFYCLFKKIGTTYSGNMSPSNDVSALISLVNAFRPKRFLEIGLNLGHTAKQILQYSPFLETYIGVDIPFDQKEKTLGLQSYEVPEKAGCECLDRRLTTILRPYGVKNIDPNEIGTFDFIFIDGDHSMEGVILDTEYSENILNPTGIIVWHDYAGVTTVSEYLEKYNTDKCSNRIWWIKGTLLAFRIGSL